MTNEKSVVFVVDDSLTLRKMMQRVMEQMEFQVYEASCGEDALKLFDTVVPDAILLDVEMPGMGGFVTCERVRALPVGKHIPIMMVTSLEDLESINRAYKAGATDFATKPINWDIIGHRVLYMIRTGRDYLELQKTKQELNDLNLDLEERVIERTKQLKLTNQELKQTLDELHATQSQLIESEKLASLGSLVGGVAHEVNTPIGITVTAVSMLKKNSNQMQELFTQNKLKRADFSGFLTETKDIIKISETNLQHAVDLIKSFKQIAADQISENRRTFNLKEFLEEFIFTLKPELNKTKHQVIVNCPADLQVDTYPGALFRILVNFVMNSIAHGYEPDIAGTLTIAAELQGDNVVLSYSDNGKGIAPENLNKIFDPFFTTRRGSGNIGLGLNIAYNTATKVMGGSLKCTSKLGEGVVFTLTFPRGV